MRLTTCLPSRDTSLWSNQWQESRVCVYHKLTRLFAAVTRLEGHSPPLLHIYVDWKPTHQVTRHIGDRCLLGLVPFLKYSDANSQNILHVKSVCFEPVKTRYKCTYANVQEGHLEPWKKPFFVSLPACYGFTVFRIFTFITHAQYLNNFLKCSFFIIWPLVSMTTTEESCIHTGTVLYSHACIRRRRVSW